MNIKNRQFIDSLLAHEFITLEIHVQLLELLPDEGVPLQDLANYCMEQRLCHDVEFMKQLIASIENGTALPSHQTESASAPAVQQVQDTSSGIFPDLSSIQSMQNHEVKKLMEDILQITADINGSDLHISAASEIFIRKHLQVTKIGNYVITEDDSYHLNTVLLTPEQKEEFDENNDLDYAIAINKGLRIRVNLMRHKDGIEGTYRIIPNKVKTLEELSFSARNIDTITKMLDNHNGLILITGPINSGKTTTLAALVGILNKKRNEHIITMEQPLEIVQKSHNCNIMQREIGHHTKTYATALKASLREDPDVIVLGELRDLETIEMAITASETGHLVIGTLHTADASSTLNRILDVFPPSQQSQIRTMVAGSLRGIICQQLIPGVNDGLVVASEVLVATSAVSNLISDGKTHQLAAVMQTGTKHGMCTMDQSIHDLYLENLISYETVMEKLNDENLKREIKRAVEAPDEDETQNKKKKGWFK